MYTTAESVVGKMVVVRRILIAVTYVSLFILVIFFINEYFIRDLLKTANLINWDAEYYQLIRNYGYEGRRVAFFPLFPLMWRAIPVDLYGIALVNTIIFLACFLVLSQEFNFSIRETIFYLSIPAFFFFFLPYSETVFFAANTFLLLGLKRNIFPAVLVGVLFASLARPAFTVLIPAYFVTELLTRQINKQFFIRVGLFTGVSLAGLVMVGFIQHWYTTEWFTCFSAQKYWYNRLQIPSFPLTSWGDGKTLRLDASAALFGAISGGTLLYFLIRLKETLKKSVPREVIFSLGYLAGITLSVLLFRGGSLFSLNRFFFAVPFVIIVVNYWIKLDLQLKPKQLLIIFLLMNAFWLIFFGSYNHIQTFIRYFFLSVYLFLFFMMKSRKEVVSIISMIFMILLNIYFQLFFCIRFLEGLWVG